MTIEFKSTPLNDAIIFSGVDINYRKQLNDTRLTGEAADSALNHLKDSYDKHKSQVAFKYGKFLKIIEGNLSELKRPDTPKKVRNAVANKLTELANTRIIKENKFSGLHKFFHKIGQIFRGHGFRTKGEWGLELASSIQNIDLETLKSQLNQTIFQGLRLEIGEKSPKEILNSNDMKDTINNLSDMDFKKIISDVIFMKKEEVGFGKKNKLVFYNNLNATKGKIFADELLARKDWFEQAYDLLEGASPEKINEFISNDDLIKLFKSKPERIVKLYNSEAKDKYFEKIFFPIVEITIQKELNNRNYLGIAKLIDEDKIPIKRILESSKILTPENIKLLKENIKINTFDY